MAVEIKRVKATNKELIKELTAIETEAFGAGGLNIWGLVPMIHYGAVFVLYQAKNPVAIIEYMRSFDQPKTAYLYGLAVKKEYRQSGLGRRLLSESLAEVKTEGFKEVLLTVDPDNQRAIKLYQELGFKQIDFSAKEYGEDQDRLIMILKF